MFVVCRSLFVVSFVLVVGLLLFVGCCSLCVVYYWFMVLLHVSCCSLFVVCCSLVVVCVFFVVVGRS